MAAGIERLSELFELGTYPVWTNVAMFGVSPLVVSVAGTRIIGSWH
ncbi:hypothetical protein SAMN03159448_05056 [Sinorhizobium sp. NFACC03]|nr:hypothetical protein SAMN03159448_05056 [Sinorhizobium sp. NFACC03]